MELQNGFTFSELELMNMSIVISLAYLEKTNLEPIKHSFLRTLRNKIKEKMK